LVWELTPFGQGMRCRTYCVEKLVSQWISVGGKPLCCNRCGRLRGRGLREYVRS